jgi:hypothetical protein
MSRGNACKQLLGSPHAMNLLTHTLGTQTPPSGGQAPDADLLMYHISILAQLCNWIASVSGLQGLQQAAQHLTLPMVGVLDRVLPQQRGG